MKLLAFVSLAAALGAASATYTEVVNGVTYITSGPSRAASLAEYERPTYFTALQLLSDRLSAADAPRWNRHQPLPKLKAELKRVKDTLGSEGLSTALAKDITDADAFWHDVIDNSTPGNMIPIDGRGVFFLPNITAVRFALWFSSPLADMANNDANAEHYFKRTVDIGDGVLEAEILEGWGGVTTLFSIDNFGKPDYTRHPFLRRQPEFPYQFAGDKVLRDGTGAVYGVLHISVRDVNGADYGETRNGTEVLASLWYGDAATDKFLQGESEHMVIEIINLSQQAQRDFDSGAFKPPV